MSTLTLTLAGILLIGGILLMRARRHGKYPSIPGLTVPHAQEDAATHLFDRLRQRRARSRVAHLVF
jgi:hypothetical protein